MPFHVKHNNQVVAPKGIWVMRNGVLTPAKSASIIRGGVLVPFFTFDSIPPVGSVSVKSSEYQYVPFTITCTASDNVGVASVQFKRSQDGSSWSNLGPLLTEAPYTITTSESSTGTRYFCAVIADEAGNEFVTDPVSISIIRDTVNPTGSISLSDTGVYVDEYFSIICNASDNVGVNNVTFQRRPPGGSWEHLMDKISPPWTISHKESVAGSYSYRAIIYDLSANSYTTPSKSNQVYDRP